MDLGELVQNTDAGKYCILSNLRAPMLSKVIAKYKTSFRYYSQRGSRTQIRSALLIPVVLGTKLISSL